MYIIPSFNGFVICIGAITIVGIVYYYIYISYLCMKNVPCLPGIPILKNGLDFSSETTLLTYLRKQVSLRGTILRFAIGPVRPSLLVSDPKLIQYMVTNSKYFRKGPFYQFSKRWLETGVLTSEGSKWRSRRKILTKCLHDNAILKKYVSTFNRQGNILMKVFETQINDGDVDLLPLMKHFSIDVICEILLDVQINTQEKGYSEYARNVEILQDIFFERATSIIKQFDFLYKFTKDFQKEKQAIKILNEFFDELYIQKCKKIAQIKQNAKDGLPMCVMDMLLSLELDGKSLMENDIREEINTLIFGGYETTAIAMSLALYELAKYPDIQEKIYKEQFEVLGTNINTSSTSYEDLEKMEYLGMVIKECLRRYSPGPFMARQTTQEVRYGNITIPKETTLLNFTYGTQLNAQFFQDPEKLIPERFNNDLIPYSYAPFGIGPRICLGKRYAMLEMKQTISEIFRSYRLKPSKDHVLQLVPRITLFPRTGLYVTAEKR